MFADASLPEKILWAVLIILVLGYLAGTWMNRQRGKAIGAWLQAGIGSLGGRPAWKIVRSASAGGQVSIADPAPPFRQVQINYALLTRELPPLWAYEYLRGKRDLLAVRANLRAVASGDASGDASGEIEVLPRGGELARRLDHGSAGESWQWTDGPAGLGIACRGRVDDRLLASVKKLLDRYGPQVQRLSIRPTRGGNPPGGAPTGEQRSGGAAPFAALRGDKGQRSGGSGGQLYLAGAVPGASRPDLLFFMSLVEPGRFPAAQLLNALRDVAREAARAAA